MSRLPETLRQRWTRLHRRIKAAGYMPASTIEGCERQAAMLDAGRLDPRPPPSEAMRRVQANDQRRHDERDLARMDSEEAYADWTAADVRERAAEEREHQQDREWPYRPPETNSSEET